MAEGTLVGLYRLRNGFQSRGRWYYGDRNQRVVLAADNHDTAVCRPRDGEPFTPESNVRRTGPTPYVPEATGPVTRDGSKLGLFDRVPGHTLDTASMTSKLRAVLHLRFLGVPYAQGTVGRAGGDEVACWAPCDCADSTEVSIGVAQAILEGGLLAWEDIRVGTGTS